MLPARFLTEIATSPEREAALAAASTQERRWSMERQAEVLYSLLMRHREAMKTPRGEGHRPPPAALPSEAHCVHAGWWVPGKGFGDVLPAPLPPDEAGLAAGYEEEEGVALDCQEVPAHASRAALEAEGAADLESAGAASRAAGAWALRCLGAGDSRAACGDAGGQPQLLCRARGGDLTPDFVQHWTAAGGEWWWRPERGAELSSGEYDADERARRILRLLGPKERAWYRRDGPGACRKPASVVIALQACPSPA